MPEPLISIIIPVYNPGRHLIRCLDSILNQTYRNLQIILIDDGSTDGSDAICDEYARKDSRVTCVHQKNTGVSAARNAGLDLSTGDFFHFPDSDDYLEPDTYEYLLNCIVKYECDMVNYEYFVSYSSNENRHLLNDDHYGLVGTKEAHRLIMAGEPFTWNKLFSKSLITANEHLPGIRFREDIFRGEDTLFAHEATARAEKVWFDKRPLYHYVQTEESAVRGCFRVSQLSALKLYDAYQCLFWEKYPELKPLFLKSMSHLLISLYYDMWADKDVFLSEMEKVYNVYKKYERELFSVGNISKKEELKFRLFSYSPRLFCKIHKSIHNL